MKKILVTGGTVFVSKSVAEYFSSESSCGTRYEVFVLNRGSREVPEGTHLIRADRTDASSLKTALAGYDFDVVIDVCAYTGADIQNLLSAIKMPETYILISSSAVYPETEVQPFTEKTRTGRNSFWNDYGTNKIEAEKALFSQKSDAYAIRPPYLYGPGNNVYREAFAFDCAEQGRAFYLPKNGRMRMQFYYIEDLCKILKIIIDQKPSEHIINVGNESSISVLEWVRLCYKAVGADFTSKNVPESLGIEQRNYFPFYDYEYFLDVSIQKSLFKGDCMGKTLTTTSLEEGLKKSYEWYRKNKDKVRRKEYIDFIDGNFGQDASS